MNSWEISIRKGIKNISFDKVIHKNMYPAAILPEFDEKSAKF